MKQRLIILLMLVMTFVANAQTLKDIHETKYDWSDLAQQITAGKTSKYDQAYAIYRWICDNISYDTTRTIFDADSALEQKRGVCQGYCELFYRLGEPLGLRTQIIFGKAKDIRGTIDESGHTWIFVFTDGNSGIFVDPTWGAGSVDNGVFARAENDDSWFHVDPRWLIFTHFPDDSTNQLLDTPIDYDTFLRMKPLYPELKYFGFDSEELFRKSLTGESPELPKCYVKKGIDILSIPLDATLRVGKSYDFILNTQEKYEFCAINEKDYSEVSNPDGSRHEISFVPSAGGELTLGYRRKGTNGNWKSLVQYKVDAPTAADIEALGNAAPEKALRLMNLENYYPNIFKKKGIDFASLLKEVKRDNISKLTNISSDGNFRIDSMPMNGILTAGQTYTFKFSPYEEGDWVIINGEEWLRDWKQDPGTRVWEMTVEAADKGELQLGFKAKSDRGKTYSIFMEYIIK